MKLYHILFLSKELISLTHTCAHGDTHSTVAWSSWILLHTHQPGAEDLTESVFL
jgi:hypothetical protein